MELPKERLEPNIDLRALKKVYSDRGWDPLWGGWDSEPQILKGGDNEQGYITLREKWLSVIFKNFNTYLIHRWLHFERLLYDRNTYIYYELSETNTLWEGTYAMIPPHLKETTPLNKIPPSDFYISNYKLITRYEALNDFLKQKIGKWFFSIAPHYCLKILTSLVVILGLVIGLIKKGILKTTQNSF